MPKTSIRLAVAEQRGASCGDQFILPNCPYDDAAAPDSPVGELLDGIGKQRGRSMTENRSLDELGPVDYLIVEFPAGAQNFTGEGAAELVRLHDAGIIRVMDILILQKAEDGTVMAQELGDLEKLSELARIEAELVQTLAEEDVDHLAAAMDPGSVAGVLVYENLWAAPFGSAMRRAGGQLIANGRIPVQAIIAAVEADAALETQGV
jgi:Family of unknown function (DUF6325)